VRRISDHEFLPQYSRIQYFTGAFYANYPNASPFCNCRKINLCNTSVRLKPLTRLLKFCPTLEYLNLNSCRGLPRGMKRLHADREKVVQLRDDIISGKYNKDDSE
jgi:hypothetical protein